MRIIPGTASDPIAQFGQQSANWLLRSLKDVPRDARPAALRSLFKSIDPALLRRVEKISARLQGEGVPVEAALRAGIAAGMSQGLLDEYKKLGRGSVPRARSISGLAGHQGRMEVLAGYDSHMQALGFSIGGAWKKVRGTVVGTASTIVSGPAAFIAPVVAHPAVGRRIRGAVSSAGSTVKKWGESAVGAIGKYACKVATSNVGKAGALVAGGPAAAAGAQVASNICSGDPSKPVAPIYAPPRRTMPNWVVPAAIGGAALAVILAVR